MATARAKSSSHVTISHASRGSSVSFTLKNTSGANNKEKPKDKEFYRLCYEGGSAEKEPRIKDENDNETVDLIKNLQRKYPKTSIASIQIETSARTDDKESSERERVIGSSSLTHTRSSGESQERGKSNSTSRDAKLSNDPEERVKTKSVKHITEDLTVESSRDSKLSNRKAAISEKKVTEKKPGRVSSIRAKFQTQSTASDNSQRPAGKSSAQKANSGVHAKRTRVSNLSEVEANEKGSSSEKGKDKELGDMQTKVTLSRDGVGSLKHGSRHATARSYTEIRDELLKEAGLPSDTIDLRSALAEGAKTSPFIRTVTQTVLSTRSIGNVSHHDATQNEVVIHSVTCGKMRYNNEARIDAKQTRFKVSEKYNTNTLSRSPSMSQSPFVKTVYQDCQSQATLRKMAQTSGRDVSAFDESVIVAMVNCYKEQNRHDRIHFRRLRRERTERYKSDPLDTSRDRQKSTGTTPSVITWSTRDHRLSAEFAKCDYAPTHESMRKHMRCPSVSPSSGGNVVPRRSNSLDNLFSWIQSQAKYPEGSSSPNQSNRTDDSDFSADSIIIDRTKIVHLDTAKTLLDGATSPNSIRRATHLNTLRDKSANRLSLSLIAGRTDRIVEKDESEDGSIANTSSIDLTCYSQTVLERDPQPKSKSGARQPITPNNAISNTNQNTSLTVGCEATVIVKDGASHAFSNTKQRSQHSRKSPQISSIADRSYSDDEQRGTSRRGQFDIVAALEPKVPETSQAVVRKLYRNKTFDYGEMSTTTASVCKDYVSCTDGGETISIDAVKKNDAETTRPTPDGRGRHSGSSKLTHALDTKTRECSVDTNERLSSSEEQESKEEVVRVSTLRSLFELDQEPGTLNRSRSWRQRKSKPSKPSTEDIHSSLSRSSSNDPIEKNTNQRSMPAQELSLRFNEPHSESIWKQRDVAPRDDRDDNNSMAMKEIQENERPISSDSGDGLGTKASELTRRGSDRRSRKSFVVDNVLYASPGEELFISSGFHSLPGRHRRGRALSTESDASSTVSLPSSHPMALSKRPLTLSFDLKAQPAVSYSASDNQLYRPVTGTGTNTGIGTSTGNGTNIRIGTNVGTGTNTGIGTNTGAGTNIGIGSMIPLGDVQSIRDTNCDSTPSDEISHRQDPLVSKDNGRTTALNVATVAPMVIDQVEPRSLEEDKVDLHGKELSSEVAHGVKPLDGKREGNRVRIEVVVGNQEQINAYDINAEDLDAVSTWDEFESTVRTSFEKHVQSIEPNYLQITSDDIHKLIIGRHEVALGENYELSHLRKERKCQIQLKGPPRHLASLAYETLLPKSHIAKFLSLILTNHFVIFYGPSGTGKSYFAKKLVQLLERRLTSDGVHLDLVTVANVNSDKWKELLDGCLKEVSAKRPTVLLLDGFSNAFMKDVEHISQYIDRLEFKGIYVVGTVTQSYAVDVPIEWQQQFRWVWLPNHEEPVRGMLRRYMRREIMQIRDRSRWPDLFDLADWLSSLWKHVNTYIEKYNAAELAIGPTMFLSCPLDVKQSEEWFVDLWNYSIVPYFLQTVKKGIRMYGQPGQWRDPLEWIISTYPWHSTDDTTVLDSTRKLRRVRVEDVGLKDAAEVSQGGSKDDQDRLMDFLRRLETFVDPSEEQQQQQQQPPVQQQSRHSDLDTNQRMKNIVRSQKAKSQTRPYLESAL